MVDEVGLKEMERRTIRAYHEDGLIDIFIGAYFLFFSLYFSLKFDYARFLLIIPGFGRSLYLEAKKRITDPRLGYVRLTKSRTLSFAFYMFIVTMAVGFITLTGLFYHMGVPEEAPTGVLFLNRINLLFQGAKIATVLISLGWFMHLSRLYIYSAITLLVFTSGYIYLDQPYVLSMQNTATSCLFTGVIISILGLTRLRRFIHKYPEMHAG
jgi:hypothetical protein